MTQQILSEVKNKTSQLRDQIKQKREQLVGGSPGQTEIAGNALNEIQSRMSERFDVMQERRPRLLSDALNMDKLPLDVTEQGGGILGKIGNTSRSKNVDINTSRSNKVDVNRPRSNKVDVSGASNHPKVDVSQVEFSGGEQKGKPSDKSGLDFSG